MDDKVKRYVVDVVDATRNPAEAGLADLANLIENGASVRASINLIKVAKAHALLGGRSYISPHDVKSIARDVLCVPCLELRSSLSGRFFVGRSALA